ncbi:type IV secretory system conjugative DNA transfer family protein [Bradyrhizobium diazoefficiens]|uniref:type IV secretory system conjugative DNA transfer family protein n=1 Tax=Bradyrhizobium diazoefficiens TaxID=1355477 RepID=UPI000D72A3C8|nr:type IV secretory system conjugative DNA transfer family protein [Bradyrhizobium diazoefficiens]AWO92420.1 type IV secretory system conjugative DNA transfer family protein [Bradyrhizobium diazoefficiens]
MLRFLRILYILIRLLLRAAFGLGTIVYALLTWRDRHSVDALGTARFATWWELLRAGVRRGNGPIVGRIGRSFLRFNKDGMVTVFAPMGAGKGVGIVIPNLLSYKGSIVCTDIKGENRAITERQRRKMGRVRALDTLKPRCSDKFNPLDMVRTGTWHERDDAEALAKLMVMPDGSESHWDSKAEGMLACLILYTVRLEPGRRTLSQIRNFSTLPPESFKELLQTIGVDGPVTAAELAASFLAMESSEEFKSVLSNVEKATRVWSAGGPAAHVTSESTFNLSELVDQTTTLYLVVDEEKLSVYAGFLRVMVGCAINALTRAKGRKRPRHKVLLLLDEAAALGCLEPLERGVGYLRAYCTPMLIFQDMHQLKALYRRWGSFLANSTCKVFFNVADLEAARFVSEMLGQTTSVSRSEGTSQANTDLLRQQLSSGQSEAGRWLLDPSEVLRLPGKRSIVLYRSDILRFAVLAKKVNYRAWRNVHWWGKYDSWPRKAASGCENAQVQALAQGDASAAT